MKTLLLHYFTSDTGNNGMDTSLFTDKKEMFARLLETARGYDEPEDSALFTAEAETTPWLGAWEAFKDRETDQQNYFSYGEQEIELPTACPYAGFFASAGHAYAFALLHLQGAAKLATLGVLTEQKQNPVAADKWMHVVRHTMAEAGTFNRDTENALLETFHTLTRS